MSGGTAGTPAAPRPALTVTKPPTQVPGYVHGLRQASMQVQVRLDTPPDATVLARLEHVANAVLGPTTGSFSKDCPVLIDRLADWACRLMMRHGMPVVDTPRITGPTPRTPDCWTLYLPCMQFDAAGVAISLAIGLANIPPPVVTGRSLEAIATWFRQQVEARKDRLLLGRPSRPDTAAFVAAAQQLDIPWTLFHGQIIQFGIGRAARLLDGAVTERTALLGVRLLERDAGLAEALLKDAGLPVNLQDLPHEAGPDESHYVSVVLNDALIAVVSIKPGGEEEPIAIERVHPDNRLLLRRAARVLHLDFASVELTTGDIGQPWHATGGMIRSVKTRYPLPKGVHGPFLQHLMGAQKGRIPVAVVISMDPQETLSGSLQAHLVRDDYRAGLTNHTGVRLGLGVARPGTPGSFEGPRALIMDPSLEMLVIGVHDQQVLGLGWPIAACDVLLVGGNSAPVGPADAAAAQQRLHRLCQHAASLRPGLILVDGSDPHVSGAIGSIPWLRRYHARAHGLQIIGQGDEPGAAQTRLVATAAQWLARVNVDPVATAPWNTPPLPLPQDHPQAR